MKEVLAKVDMLQFVTALAVLTAFLVIVFVLLFRPIPEANKDAVMLLLGGIIGSVGTMVAFYYGSSKGSAKKDDIIKEQVNQAAIIEAKKL